MRIYLKLQSFNICIICYSHIWQEAVGTQNTFRGDGRFFNPARECLFSNFFYFCKFVNLSVSNQYLVNIV